MSGEIIDFRSLRGQKRAKLYRQQAVPRPQPGPANLGEKVARLLALDEQITRIVGLLEELEDLTRNSPDVPATLRLRAQASIDLAGGVLRAARGRPADDATDDPQPEIDREALERMYRDLDLHA